MQKISVPQSDGEVVIDFAGDGPVTYRVSDGQINARDEHAQALVAGVPGAKFVKDPKGAKPAPKPQARAVGTASATEANAGGNPAAKE